MRDTPIMGSDLTILNLVDQQAENSESTEWASDTSNSSNDLGLKQLLYS